MKKIISIIGARPQFIKVAPFAEAVKKKLHHLIIHTGQHYDYEMSKIFFKELKIPKPNYNLNVDSTFHGQQTSQMLSKIEPILLREKPDTVIVYGDTNSTLAGALAASKLKIPVTHIEAGMRSYNRQMPEEINRIVTDHLSDINFCSTPQALKNLKKEGINKNIFQVGDIMSDTLRQVLKKTSIKNNVISRLKLSPKKYILVTIHRASNTDVKENLSSIVKSLINLDEKVIFPLHPRTKKYLVKYEFYFNLKNCKNIQILKPICYFDMIHLEKNARLILTDSGGIQKEACLLNVPCLTLRNETEWIETVKGGWNTLVGVDRKKIMNGLKKKYSIIKMKKISYGQGDVAKKIVNILLGL